LNDKTFEEKQVRIPYPFPEKLPPPLLLDDIAFADLNTLLATKLCALHLTERQKDRNDVKRLIRIKKLSKDYGGFLPSTVQSVYLQLFDEVANETLSA
jgi:hypothetical protein